jgi:Arc/MetJ-type ribon-helix-helix transcriptional regulator
MATKTVRRSISMTPEMHNLLAQLVDKRGRDVSEADLIREAIRAYLDEQVDVAGSRRHFQKSLQDRLDQLEDRLMFHMNILIVVTSALLEDETALDEAIVIAKRDGDLLLKKIAAVRELKLGS